MDSEPIVHANTGDIEVRLHVSMHHRSAGEVAKAAVLKEGERLVLVGGEALHGLKPMVILVSPSEKQSIELLLKVNEHWRLLSGAAQIRQDSKTRMEFANGARIVSLPGSEATVRGFSAVTMVILDEAAGVDESLIPAVNPMQATTGGRFLALSTPKGRRGWFFETWEHGENWERVSVRASECPRISAEFLAQEHKDLGPLMFSQEYECQFIDSNTSAFSSQLIEQALVDDFAPF